MDDHTAELMATVSRIETKLDDLKEVSVVRLNSHAGKSDSLERTRDRQWGAAKLGAIGLTIVGAVLGFLRWYK